MMMTTMMTKMKLKPELLRKVGICLLPPAAIITCGDHPTCPRQRLHLEVRPQTKKLLTWPPFHLSLQVPDLTLFLLPPVCPQQMLAPMIPVYWSRLASVAAVVPTQTSCPHLLMSRMDIIPTAK